MTTETKTKLVAWNAETYVGAGDYYDQFTNDPEFLEYTEDLDHEERLRLALYAYEGGWSLVPEDMPLFIGQEQEAYWGEFETGGDFARYCVEEFTPLPDGMPDWLIVDWEASWERNLRHDFFTYEVIDIDGNFRKFFWRVD